MNKHHILPKTDGGVGVRDLARMAGVHASTVSRALNHDPRIPAERAEAIRKIAGEAAYRPRPLRSKRTRSIGLIIASKLGDRPQEQFLTRVLTLAEEALARENLHVNVEFVPSRHGRQVVLPAIVRHNRVDGVILAGHQSARLVAGIRDAGMAAVAINDSPKRLGISCVRTDSSTILQEVVRQLAAWGHRQIGLCVSSRQFQTVKARHEGYLAGLRESGIPFDPALLVDGLASDLRGGTEAVRALSSRGALPTALVLENDWMALGAKHELMRTGWAIPADVNLVGHDDIWICDELEPTLTSVHRNEQDLVDRAVRLLLAQIETGVNECREELIPGRVIWRDSTGPMVKRR